MAISIGIDSTTQNWKTCLMENGAILELCSFADAAALLAYVEHICALYPEPTVAVPYSDRSLIEALHNALKSINLNSYCLPQIKELPTIPAYRKLNRLQMGAAGQLCTVAMLIYRLFERETAWSEMNFLLLEVQQDSVSIQVVEDGQIVNGLSGMADVSEIRLHLRLDGNFSYSFGSDHRESTYRSDWLNPVDASKHELVNGHARKYAFWEGLAQELAGLMAIHHCEDIVVLGQRKEAVIEWFDDIYQLYHFPYKDSDRPGFEAATGAAIVAEGLAHNGLAAEVVERLQIRGAISSSDVNAPTRLQTPAQYQQLPGR